MKAFYGGMTRGKETGESRAPAILPSVFLRRGRRKQMNNS